MAAILKNVLLMSRSMSLILLIWGLILVLSARCFAQEGSAEEWEVSAALGYSGNHGTTIGNAELGTSASAGYRDGFVLGTVVGQNLYEHVGGEVRYLFMWGTPGLSFQGTRATTTGYSNLVVYDLLVHFKSYDSGLRPFLAAGAGIKILTSTDEQLVTQPLLEYALLRRGTQVEPAISVGGGLKYRIAPHTLLRFDFRTYLSPLPNKLFLTNSSSVIRGWVYDFVPQIGIGYTF